MRRVDADALSGKTQEGCVYGTGEGEGARGLEQWRVVGDEDGGLLREALVHDGRGEAERGLAKEADEDGG